MSCLILFKSITYAQIAFKYITGYGVNVVLMRKPGNVQGNGCGYGLKVNCSNIDKARKILEEKGIGYLSVWKNIGLEWVALQ